jgi:hypothetical protein
LRASTATTSTATAEATSTAAVATTVGAAIAAKILSTAIVAGGTRIFLRRIVLAKILRSRGVRFRLALFRLFLHCAVFRRLAFAMGFIAQGRVMFVLVSKIGVHGLFVGNGLLRSIVGAWRSDLIGAVRIGERLARQGFD